VLETRHGRCAGSVQHLYGRAAFVAVKASSGWLLVFNVA